jgi:hypothetical protein
MDENDTLELSAEMADLATDKKYQPVLVSRTSSKAEDDEDSLVPSELETIKDPRRYLRALKMSRKKKEIVPWLPPFSLTTQDAFGIEHTYQLTSLSRLFILFDDAQSSIVGKYLNFVFLLAVIIATIFLVVGTLPDVKQSHSPCPSEFIACNNEAQCPGKLICEPHAPAWFEDVQLSCNIVFCLDYFVRILLVPWVPPRLTRTLAEFDLELPSSMTVDDLDPDLRDKLVNMPDPQLQPWTKFYRYCRQPMNVIDLVAVAPFIVELFPVQLAFGTGFIRMLRLARVFRIFKIGKNNVYMVLLGSTLSKSLPALMLMGFFLALGVIIFGSTMYFIESGTYTYDATYRGEYIREDLYGVKNEETPFTSIPISFYWAITTSTTVGYGDLYPTTAPGRLVCIISTFCAMIVLALPISVIGNNFNREYDNVRSGKVQCLFIQHLSTNFLYHGAEFSFVSNFSAVYILTNSSHPLPSCQVDVVVESCTDLLRIYSTDTKLYSQEELVELKRKRAWAILTIAQYNLSRIKVEFLANINFKQKIDPPPLALFLRYVQRFLNTLLPPFF